MHEDIKIIRAIAQGDSEAYRKLYTNYYTMVRYLVVNNRGNEEDAKDVFHDSVIAIIEKTNDPKFELRASIKTFLYSVARNIWYARVRKNKNVTEFEDFERFVEDDTELERKKMTEWQLNVIEACLEKMGDPCKTLLMQFYYFKKSMTEIAKMLDYTSADHAKSQKYKCMKRLKSLATNG